MYKLLALVGLAVPLLTAAPCWANVLVEDPAYDAYMRRHVNDQLYYPPAPGYLDVLYVAAEVVGSELRVHITTRENIPLQAPGVYVFQCLFDDPECAPGSRILVAVLGQSEPKYGCNPNLSAVGAAVVVDNPETYTRLSSAFLAVAGNVLTLRTTTTSLLRPGCFNRLTARYYNPQGEAFGEAVDSVLIRPIEGGSAVFGLGPPFVGATPANEGLHRGGPAPALPPQKRDWFNPKAPCGCGWYCPPLGHQLPLLPSPPNGDRDFDDDGTDDWYYGPSLRGGGSEMRGWNNPNGGDEFAAVIPRPGGVYEFIARCPWPGGVNDWFIDEDGLAHW